MTRETKIGLLVGLAFIIVIGILLSDHINAANDPLAARLTDGTKSLDDSTRVPNAQKGSETVVLPPQPVVPQTRIKTEPETDPRQNSGTVIEIQPGNVDPSTLRIPERRSVVQGPTQNPEIAEQPQGAGQAPITLKQDNGGIGENIQIAGGSRPTNVEQTQTNNPRFDDLANAARKNNEEIVNANSGKVGVSTQRQGVQIVARPDARQVVAEENDTVSKFASKYMGGNTKVNRDAIIKANPSVGTDGSKVFAGKTYLIPTPPVTGQQAPANQTVVQSPPPQQQQAQEPTQSPVRLKPQPQTATASATPNTAMYTVKENDTLWKIASEQLGSGARYTEIVELNKDVLKGNAQLRPNMRLKMPAKAVAANN